MLMIDSEIVELKLFLIRESDELQAYLIYRNYYWHETFECQKRLNELIRTTITMATIGDNVFRFQNDHRISIYPNIVKRYDHRKHRLHLLDSKGFSDYGAYELKWEKIIEKLYEHYHIRYQPQIRATITADYPIELTMEKDEFQQQQIPYILHLYAWKNDDNDYENYERLMFREWQQTTNVQTINRKSRTNEKIFNIINISIDGIYYRIMSFIMTDHDPSSSSSSVRIFETIDIENEIQYAMVCWSVDERMIYLEKNLKKSCTPNNNNNTSDDQQLFNQFEFAFNLMDNLYFISIRYQQIFFTSKKLMIELNRKFPFERLNFHEFFYCDNQTRFDQTNFDNINDTETKNLTLPIQMKYYYRRPKMEKPNILKAFIEIIIGIKYLFIITYLLFTLYILQTFEMNQWLDNLWFMGGSSSSSTDVDGTTSSGHQNQLKHQLLLLPSSQQQEMEQKMMKISTFNTNKQILINEQFIQHQQHQQQTQNDK